MSAFRSFGRLLFAAIVVVAAVALAEQYDARVAWLFALATLGALFLTNASAVAEIRALLGS